MFKSGALISKSTSAIWKKSDVKILHQLCEWRINSEQGGKKPQTLA